MAKRVTPRWRGTQTPIVNARSVLPALTVRYLRIAGKVAANGKPSPKALQKLRRETKRLRYTLELFRPSLGPMLAGRLEALREIQQSLVEINDCATTRNLLFGKKRPASRQLLRVWKFLEARAGEKTTQLTRQLRGSVQGPQRRRWWADYRRPAAEGSGR